MCLMRFREWARFSGDFMENTAKAAIVFGIFAIIVEIVYFTCRGLWG